MELLPAGREEESLHVVVVGAAPYVQKTKKKKPARHYARQSSAVGGAKARQGKAIKGAELRAVGAGVVLFRRLERDLEQRVEVDVGAGGGVLAFEEEVVALEDEDAALLEALVELGRYPGLPARQRIGQVLGLAGFDAIQQREGRGGVEGEAADVLLEVECRIKTIFRIRKQVFRIKADVVRELGAALRGTDAHRQQLHALGPELRHRLPLERRRQLLTEESSVTPEKHRHRSLVGVPQRPELHRLERRHGPVHPQPSELLVRRQSHRHRPQHRRGPLHPHLVAPPVCVSS
eukprot:CAMPEP_0198656552 /NCGR_PEP_ID=MMETSP1467-20131203/10092_1 /TAXON_ID=1462469 /ORGANISM="unid. sp., Strain CCMP2135" /LENGTH=290 /DNA_ID=CAMNT_0044392599 /DNA_START=200 /DNA_END=1068 /DNA_ORIENTATION=-